MNMSPGAISAAGKRLSSSPTVPIIEPRWIGTRCAWAITLPAASKIADEQSARSLMLGENAVRVSVAPISSAASSR